ncbi:MAG: phage holin family protein [Sphingomonas sp.]|uniref:phage holin family protein n=1 Tax=Sphingomonas sp. TaxID=28214 RepID=UPI001B218C6D|nr:phage holin family protein [Sphingomonas sp.]MBO9622792.1 phage holin family protein [Sphingomonas sp.]
MEEPGAQEESIGELFGRLVEDGKGFARAELGYYRAVAADKLAQAKAGLILAGVALLLALAGAIALVVGLVLTLAALIGPGWATLVVVLATLLVAALLGWLAWRHFQRMTGSGQ